MSVDKHRTLLFAADLEGSRQMLGRCTILTQDTVFGKAGDGVVFPGTVAEEDEPATGWRIVPTVGRGERLNTWDGKPGDSRAVEAMIFPELEQTHTMVTWQGQNFGAFCTEWETLHSPLVAVSPPPKPTPVVDACGAVIGYHLKKISTSFLFATEKGEIYCTGYVTNSSVYGPNTRSLIGNALYFTTADKIVDGASLTSDMVYTQRIKKDKWADVLVDIDGFVLAIDSYGDPKEAPSTFETVIGFLLPTPPDASCVHNEFGEPVEEETWDCAMQRSMFIIDMVLLIAPLSKIKNLAKARKLLATTQAVARRLKVGAQVALRGARGMNKAVRLSIHVPQVELKAASAAVSGGKKAKKLLGAEKSGKKANFMEVDLGNKTGMTHMAIRDVRAKMAKHGVRIRFRPAGTARKLRKHGAVPKWEELKMKTINDDDILLGAPKSGKSQPGYFKPKLPDPKLKQADPARYEQVMKRYKQRDEEFRELAEKVKKYEKDGDIVVQDGVVKDGATGKDIAGDYDIYEILDKNGKRITDADPRYNKIIDDLRGRRIGAQHGAHVEWKPKDPFEKKIYDDIVERHRTKEPLYEFREDGSIWETFAD